MITNDASMKDVLASQVSGLLFKHELQAEKKDWAVQPQFLAWSRLSGGCLEDPTKACNWVRSTCDLPPYWDWNADCVSGELR